MCFCLAPLSHSIANIGLPIRLWCGGRLFLFGIDYERRRNHAALLEDLFFDLLPTFLVGLAAGELLVGCAFCPEIDVLGVVAHFLPLAPPD